MPHPPASAITRRYHRPDLDEPMVRTTLRLTEELYQRIIDVADSRNCSIGLATIELIEAGLAAAETAHQSPER